MENERVGAPSQDSEQALVRWKVVLAVEGSHHDTALLQVDPTDRSLGLDDQYPGLARRAEQLEQVRQRGGAASMLQRVERRAHQRWTVSANQLNAVIRYGAGETEIVVEDLSLGGARLTTRRPIPQGDRVTLSLAATANRARRMFIDARVVRIDEAEGAYTAPTFRAGLEFLPDEAVHNAIKTMIDGLPGARDPRGPAR